MMRIDFTWTDGEYNLNDTLVMTDAEFAASTPDEREAMKADRFAVWLDSIKNPLPVPPPPPDEAE